MYWQWNNQRYLGNIVRLTWSSWDSQLSSALSLKEIMYMRYTEGHHDIFSKMKYHAIPVFDDSATCVKLGRRWFAKIKCSEKIWERRLYGHSISIKTQLTFKMECCYHVSLWVDFTERSTSIPNLWYSTEEGPFLLQKFPPLTTFCSSSLHSLQALWARIVCCYMTSDALVKTDSQAPAPYK